MKEEKLSFLNGDTEEEDKLEDEGVGEKLGPTGKNKRKLVNLTF